MTALTNHEPSRGPRCQHCPRDEATCARNGGCCTHCTHTFGEVEDRRANDPTCRTCGRTFPHGRQGRPPARCPLCRLNRTEATS